MGLAGQICIERVVRSKAIAADDVPLSVDALTPQWLTALLCRDAPDAEVRALRIRQVSSGTHARHRLHLDWNEAGRRAGKPATIFTKSLPSFVTRMVA